ncbi:MAG: glycosyl hydrolase family 28 protein [Breznakibacter sp.]
MAFAGYAQAWLKEVGAKKFPSSDKIYKVNDYKAYKNSFVASTPAIQKAIDECARNGGGKVVFEPGVYHTGALFLKSNVNLEIGEEVELRALIGLEYYPEIKTRVAGIEMMWPCGIINILNQENVAVTGKGILHAQGKIHWERYWNLRHAYEPQGLRWASDYDCKRVRTLEVADSKHVTISGITIKQSGFWTVHVMYCANVTVDGVTVLNNIDGKGPSTDGIDIDSSSYVEVMNCDTDCNDDNYCVKSGRDADGLRVGVPSEYIYFHDNIARAGGGILVLGSETSGWIRHVKAERMRGYGSHHILHLKSALTRGGGIEFIEVDNCVGEGVRQVLNVSLNWNPNYSYIMLPQGDIEIPEHWKVMSELVPKDKGIARFRHVSLTNCKAIDVPRAALDVTGMEESYIEDFKLENLDITAARAGSLKFINRWEMKNITITTPGGEPLQIENAKRLTQQNVMVLKK